MKINNRDLFVKKLVLYVFNHYNFVVVKILDFITANRRGKEISKQYDIVIGPVAYTWFR